MSGPTHTDGRAAPADEDGRVPRPNGELVVRIASALVLAALALALVYAGTLPFAVLVGLGAVVVGWEWGRIVRGRDRDGESVLHAIFLLAAAGLAGYGLAILGVLALLVGACLMLLLRMLKGDGWSALGVVYVGFPVIALLWLREDGAWGWPAILLIFAVVWATDSLAFVVGRSVGGPRLWPRISPRKTWSGAIGGLAGGTAAAFAVATAFGLREPAMVAAIGAGLSLTAQIGDLAESALKRRFGQKDASALIPGHGGLFDRVDGLMLAADAAAVFALVTGPTHPAAALLLQP